MTLEEIRTRAFDKWHAAHLASMAHTGDAQDLQAEGDTWNDLADTLERLHALQATLHAPGCAVHDVGSVEFPNCSCGLSVAIQHAGGKAKR